MFPMVAGRQLDCKSQFLCEMARKLQGFWEQYYEVYGWELRTGTSPTVCQQKTETPFRTITTWVCLCSFLSLCLSCAGGGEKASRVLGGHTCPGKELAGWVLLVGTIQQQPMPVATGWTFHRRDIEQKQGARLCTSGQGLTGGWPGSPQTPNTAGFPPLCSHQNHTWLCSFYNSWKCFSRATVFVLPPSRHPDVEINSRCSSVSSWLVSVFIFKTTITKKKKKL